LVVVTVCVLVSVFVAATDWAGGAGAVAMLVQRYRMGDPDAARTFEAIGMSPDDFSMFAGEPNTSIIRQPNIGTPVQQSSTQDQQPSANRTPRTVVASTQSKTSKETPKLPDMMSAPMPPWMVGKSARNLPQSRPKAETKPQVTKSKPKVKVKAK